jgi:hypothetical protein
LLEAARNFPEIVEIVSFVLGDEYSTLRAQIG